MWGAHSKTNAGSEYEKSANSSYQGVKIDGLKQKDGSWYVATDVPSDVLVQVGDVSFHLHKYPLLSKSGMINRITYESTEMDMDKIELNDLPGGAEAFNLAANFCYGMAIDITSSNISALRCAAEYLEMTEDFDEGNLIIKTETFLNYVVLTSWKDSILVLKSCQQLSPWAENLQIVRRCCESIAWKACTNLRAVNWAYTGKSTDTESSPRLNEINESSPQVSPDWWFEDVSVLRIDHFVRVITGIKAKGMKLGLLGASIMKYAAKWLPGFINQESGNEGGTSIKDSNTSSDPHWKGGLHLTIVPNKHDPSNDLINQQRMIIESLVSIIPQHKDTVSCTFLLRILRMANMLKVAYALVTDLEKRVGMQLEQAELADLVIPAYNKTDTLYNVDLVQRLLEHFLVQEQIEEPSSPTRQSFTETGRGTNAKIKVARLVDSYLSEVSRDKNFSMMKFQVLAEALPESARTCHDGLYRAVDSYLKAHPTLGEHDRKRLCRVMDCQKLSVDACLHAAQNERLPLRVVVQVLLSQQVKISNAISKATTNEPHYQAMLSSHKTFLEHIPMSFQEGWETSNKEINSLKFELESVKAKYLELQNDLENLQSQFDKMSKHKSSSAWTSGWKKLGRITKLTSTEETQDNGSQATTVEQIKKSRRWRNSIS